MKSQRLPLLSFVVVSFAMLTGCGATAARPAEAPSMDASWTPPEAVDLALHEDGRESLRKSDDGSANSYRPNREQIPQRGAVHAAIY